MRNFAITACLIAGALSFTSCNSGSQSGEENTATTGTATATTAAFDSTLTDNKKELMDFAARNNMLQIELGRMAVEKGSSDEVKQYGQQLVDWYTDKQQELQELAQQFNETVPQQLADDQQEYIEEVREAESGEFDQKYWDSVVDAQQEAIDKFESNLKDIDEASANAFSLWARNTRKELQAQMEQAARMKENADQ